MKALLLVPALLLIACFSVDERPCSYRCGPQGQCPDDYSCQPDGYCHLHGNTTSCGFSDLAVTDAAVDAAVDGSTDFSVGDSNPPDLTPPRDLSTPD